MYLLLLIIAIIVCVLLVFFVMIQNPKGGGLASNFSSSSQLMGVQKTGDILEKGTWGLAIALMVLSMVINIAVKGGNQGSAAQQDSYKKYQNVSKPVGAPPAVVPSPISSPSKTAPATQQPANAAPAKK